MSASSCPELPATETDARVLALRNADASRRKEFSRTADEATLLDPSAKSLRRSVPAASTIVGGPFVETCRDGGEIVAHNAPGRFNSRVIVEKGRISIDVIEVLADNFTPFRVTDIDCFSATVLAHTLRHCHEDLVVRSRA